MLSYYIILNVRYNMRLTPKEIKEMCNNNIFTNQLLEDSKYYYLTFFTNCLSLDKFSNLYNVDYETMDFVLNVGKGLLECEK